MATEAGSLFFERPEPLRSGPFEAMPASQRARMLDAVTRVVVQKGYAEVTVADVVGIARVSRRTFYEQFTDKQDCFLAAYEAGTDALLGQMVAAVLELGDDAPWRTVLETAVGTYLQTLAEHPDFARTFLIDVLGAGPVAVERRRQVYGLFVHQYRLLATRAAKQEPRLGQVPDVYLQALVGGIAELVQQHILEHGAATLAGLGPVLVQLVTAVLQGTAPAR